MIAVLETSHYFWDTAEWTLVHTTTWTNLKEPRRWLEPDLVPHLSPDPYYLHELQLTQTYTHFPLWFEHHPVTSCSWMTHLLTHHHWRKAPKRALSSCLPFLHVHHNRKKGVLPPHLHLILGDKLASEDSVMLEFGKLRAGPIPWPRLSRHLILVLQTEQAFRSKAVRSLLQGSWWTHWVRLLE